ncbi:terminase small subunit [Asticcacaulis tiandongensis]|uniref:terminase small subunit n=1 Tax=Asticcacaulis tiandongensis TaxID=2565365 RepID=UPI0015E82EF4|nr:terminase small subunit [Asticcacaulis tiandongensis]
MNLDLDELLGGTPAPRHPHNRPEIATEADLATFWDVSTRQVRKLLSDGVISKLDGRNYDVQVCTAAYLKHLAQKRSSGNSTLEAEKIRLAREQADKLELQNAAARGEYVAASDVQNTWATILRDVRASALALPGRVQTRLPHLTAHDIKIIDSEIRTVLTELSHATD